MKHKLSLITLLLAGTLNLFSSDNLGSGSRSNSFDSTGSNEGRRKFITGIADCTFDVPFKKIFKQEQCAKPIINYVLSECYGDVTITKLSAIDSEANGTKNLNTSTCYLDVVWRCNFESGTLANKKEHIVDIEMQRGSDNDFSRRTEVYLARLISNQITPRTAYKDIIPVISIAFLNYDIPDRETPINTVRFMSHSWIKVEESTRLTEANDPLIKFMTSIQLPKLLKLKQDEIPNITNEAYEEFRLMKATHDEYEVPEDEISTKTGKYLLGELRGLEGDTDYITEIETARRKASELETAHIQGIEKGKMEGKTEGMEKGDKKRKRDAIENAAAKGRTLDDIRDFFTDMTASDEEFYEAKRQRT